MNSNTHWVSGYNWINKQKERFCLNSLEKSMPQDNDFQVMLMYVLDCQLYI